MNKHIILTNGRSGSNYLAHTLNLHPNLVNYGEVLGSWAIPSNIYLILKLFGIRETSFIRYIYSSKWFFFWAQVYSALAHWHRGVPVNWKNYNDNLSLGIKEFFIHFDDHTGLEYILADKSICVIYLSRSDLVRRYISMLHMEQTKVVVDHGTASTRKKIRIEIPDMLSTLAIMQEEIDREQAWMEQIAKAGHRIFEIRYEDYFASEESLAANNELLFRFLGVQPVVVKNRQRKILSDCFSELIENHEEFCHALQNSPYAVNLN